MNITIVLVSLTLAASGIAFGGSSPSATALATSSNPGVLGRPLTLTATVLPSTATGSVTFYDGVNIVGTASLKTGQAALTTTLFPSGVNGLRAYYAGDATYAASSSPALSQTIRSLPQNGFRPAVFYNANADSPYAGDPQSLALADFNGDGITDIAEANGETIVILLGNADGTFQQQVALPSVSARPNMLAAADVNGDGKPDLVYTVTYTGVAVQLGNGDGTFQAPINHLSGNWPGGLALGDFNNDGKIDVAFAIFGAPGPEGASVEIAILLGNGDGTFGAERDYGPASTAFSVALGDFDGDGNTDIAVGRYPDTDVLFGKGDGSFGTPVTVSTQASSFVIAADFNGDGKPDLAASEYDGPAFQVLLNNGDGTFRPPVSYTGAVVAVGDFNGDGKLDLAVSGSAAPGGAYLAVDLGNGDGTFDTPVPWPSGACLSAAAADFNGDGITDIAVANSDATIDVLLGNGTGSAAVTLQSSLNPSAYGQPITLTATVTPSSATGSVMFEDGSNLLGTVALQSGTATLLVSTLSPGAHSLTAAYSGDSNDAASVGTLTQSILAGTTTTTTLTSSLNPSTLGQVVTLTATVSPSAAPGPVTFYNGANILGTADLVSGKASLNIGNLPSGTLSLAASYPDNIPYAGSSGALKQTVNAVPAAGFQPPTTIVEDSAVFVTAADFNGDGKTDLLVENEYLDGSMVLLGNGDGTFQNGLTNGAGGHYSNILVGDFNGDGKADLISSGSESLLTPGYGVSVSLGNGDGTFQTPVSYPEIPTVFAVVDFNRDGKADLYASNGGSIVPLRGNGDGTFEALPPFSVPPFSAGLGPMLAADFNGDGIPDIAFGESYPAGILLGKGDGTFQPPLPLEFDLETKSLATGDFNGDGKVDLIAVDYAGQYMSVLLGVGDGTFQPVIRYELGFGPWTVVVGDFNGDGKADALVDAFLASGGSALTVFSGNGDGTFAPGIEYPFAGESVAVGEFNGDGRTDLAIAAGNLNIVLGKPTTLVPTSTVVASSINPSVANDLVTFTATVSPSAATGQVAFNQGFYTLGTAALTGGKASFSIATLAPGSYSISAVYSGDATYSASSSTSLNEEILPPFTVAAGPNTLAVPVPGGVALGTPVVFTEGVPSSSLPNPDFTLIASGTSCTGNPGGVSCTVNVQFTPQFAGLRRGAFNVVDAANNVLATYFFSGVGTSPAPAFASPGAAVASPIYSPAIGYPFGVTVDGAGNSFVVDVYKNQLLKIAPGGAITVVPLGTALNSPYEVALDAAGNLYIADAGNNRILKLPYGASTAVAMNIANLDHPEGVAVDGAGNVYISNTRAQYVIEATPSGVSGPVSFGPLNYPSGLAVDAAGTVYVADKYNNRVFSSPNYATIGSGLSVVTGVAVDGAGNVFIADQNNGRVVKVAAGPNGPGTGAQTTLVSGLLMPNSVAVDGHGNVFVASIGSGSTSGNVLEVTNANTMQTISFGPITPQNLGTSPTLTATASSGLAVSFASKTPAVCTVSGTTLTLLASGTCAILASQSGSAAYMPAPTVAQSFSVLGSGQTLTANFTLSSSVTLGTPVVFTEGVPSTTLTNPDFTLVSSGTTCTGVVTGSCTVNVKFTPQFAGLRRGAVKLVDSHNNVVATAYISGVGANSQTPFMPGTLQTLQAYGAVSGVAVDGAGDVFFIAGSGVVYKLTGGKAISVPLGTTLNSASGLALDGAGNLYIADSGNYRVLELPYGSSSALALPITGPLVYPQGIVVDGSGNIFIANTRATVAQGNGTVIELAAGSNAQTTVIANGLNLPVGLAVDASGDLFVADWGNNRVLEVGASGAWTSIGTGLSNVSGVAVDGSGDVFILDQNHNQLVEVPGTTSGPGTGVQTTVATGLSQPNGIALDGQGDLFLSNLGTATSPGSLVEVPNR